MQQNVIVFRYAYAVVDDESDDYEPVQGPNENFGKMSMYVCS